MDDEKKTLEYRKLLLKVSNRLSSDNLATIKMLVRDTIPSVDLDRAQNGTELFVYFEERGSINKDKLGYLKQLMDAIDRQDICEFIKSFEEGGMITTPQVVNTEEDLTPLMLGEISKNIGREWKMLSRHLGLSEPEIQAISQANMYDLHEAALQALLRWRGKFGDQASVQKLKKALLDMGYRAIVQKYFKSS